MAERELSLNMSDEAKDLLVDKGWDPAMGARPLRRAIQRYVEDPLADEVLRSNMPPGSTVEVDKPEGEDGKEPDELRITVTSPPPEEIEAREPVGVGAASAAGDEEPGSPDGAGALPEGGDEDVNPLRTNPPEEASEEE